MKIFLFLVLFLSICSCNKQKKLFAKDFSAEATPIKEPKSFGEKLSNAAIAIINPAIDYDPTYFSIQYPNDDVPANKGVCTDVVIRAYRKLAIDLQKEVHEDMQVNLKEYPSQRKWGLKTTDKNIDHRRVSNLEVFLPEKEGNCLFQKIQTIITQAK